MRKQAWRTMQLRNIQACPSSHLHVSSGKISAKLDFLKKALGCSEAELCILFHKLPAILNLTEGNLTCTLEFLTMQVGLETAHLTCLVAPLVER
uniref:Uncharacterized protein n=1 Tax=Arundo donax TaxID=35708 RepID=A0A0A8YAX0_ARUDO